MTHLLKLPARYYRLFPATDPQGIAHALHAVAEADDQVKGEASSAGYALERAVRRIVASRAGEADH